MTIIRYVGNKITGTSGDTKPTNISDGATFFESDTLKTYMKISGSWSEITGYSGFSGFSGASGTSGTNGAAGTSGFSGFSGKSGFYGATAFSGWSGHVGASGASGATGSTGVGVAKLLVSFTGITTTTINYSYNVTSLTDNGTGLTTINFTSSINSGYYYCSAGGSRVTNSSGGGYGPKLGDSYNSTTCDVKTFSTSSYLDWEVVVWCINVYS